MILINSGESFQDPKQIAVVVGPEQSSDAALAGH